MDFLIRLLAQLFDRFKLKNPAAATGVLFVLALLIHAASEGTLLGLFALPEWASTAIEYVGLFLMAVTGSRTYNVLNK
jgi:hypothetical protein